MWVIFSVGLDKIEFLQSHENMDIYRKVFDMIEDYFGSEEEDTKVAPSVDPNAPQQFQFNPAQPSAFNFWDHVNLLRLLIIVTVTLKIVFVKISATTASKSTLHIIGFGMGEDWDRFLETQIKMGEKFWKYLITIIVMIA